MDSGGAAKRQTVEAKKRKSVDFIGPNETELSDR
jgi:hypothetical protein